MRYAVSLLLALTLAFGDVAFAADAPDTTKPAATAKASVEKYPAESVKELYEGCAKAKDVPADKAKAVCSCYGILMQGTIPYSVFTKVSNDLKTKGANGLDDQDKAAMEQNAYNVDYCRLKHQAVGTAEERATFPKEAMPALHTSCMNFKDIPDDKRVSFCNCYEDLVRTKVTYSDWQILSLAIETKGLDQLDADEGRTFNAVRTARIGCGGGVPAH